MRILDYTNAEDYEGTERMRHKVRTREVPNGRAQARKRRDYKRTRERRIIGRDTRR